jgi:hypothetical protein
MSDAAGARGSLIQQGFCVIFTRREAVAEKVPASSSAIRNRENPRLVRLLHEITLLPAPIPVTRLWTSCTRLKIRGLQMQTFH